MPVDIFAGDTLTDEFARLNPARETPVLELHDGTVLTQSNAILWFLSEGTAFLPESALERGQVAQWLFFEQEKVMSGIGSARFRILTGRDPAAIPARLALGQTALAILDTQLNERSSRSATPARSPTLPTSPIPTSPRMRAFAWATTRP